jgi:hypothetical protein
MLAAEQRAILAVIHFTIDKIDPCTSLCSRNGSVHGQGKVPPKTFFHYQLDVGAAAFAASFAANEGIVAADFEIEDVTNIQPSDFENNDYFHLGIA